MAMPGRRWRVRAAKALLVVLVLWLPSMAVAPSADAATLRLPSRAAIRTGLDDLWSWLTGKHQPAPVTPVQQSGTASGHGHQVPAAVSRAVARATGRAPGEGPGQLPAYRPHVPAVHQDTTKPAPGTVTFNPKTSTLITASATADLYKNADGSYTRDVYASPVNYRTPAGAWRPVSTTLVPAAGGRWHDHANSLTVSFAPRADDLALASLASGGTNGSFGLSFGLAGAARVRGTVAGPTATYRGVLAATDLTETDTATGIAERLILRSAKAPSTWLFPLALTGLTPHMRPDGSIWLVDASGAVRGVIPAGLARDSATGPRTGPIGATTPVKYELVMYRGGLALRASIDPAWLASPSRVFPVVVDPSYSATTTGTTDVLYPYTNDYSGNTLLQLGTYDSGSNYARSFLAFNGLGSALANEHITAGSLHVWDAWAWTCGSAEPFYANEITASWSVTGNKSWPGPATGNGMGELDTTAPSAACTNTSGDPSVGGWMTMTMNSTGLGDLNDWTLHPSDDYGIALTNSTTDNNQWKQFDSFNTANAPYLSLTYAADDPPQINTEYPPDNYSSASLTPELLASGSDPDSWPDPIQYVFTVYSTSGTDIASSGKISTGDWTVPAGDLTWGQEYYWTVQDYDGLDYSAAPDIRYFGTPVPQPLITSGLSQNDTGPGFDPASGNWTTSATDAQISTVGPALSVQRDYNSFDPRTTGAFGTGWSSVLDMRVSPGQTSSSGATATEVVTYPDGEQVGFGLNSNGSYTAPPGRYATLRSVSGGFTLTDKNDTVYTFTQSLGSGQYGITAITDALGHALNFTWNSSNEITTMTSAASGRALHLTWTSPSAPYSPHVASVFTDPVTSGNQNTDLTWQYSYTGDELTSVCPPINYSTCYGYTYAAGSDYPDAVLDSGPDSYWRLDETSGTTAASSVLVNEGTDNGTYSGVTLGAAGPLAGSSATSAAFNGTSSYVTLPANLQLGAAYQSVSVWFKTTATNGVLYSYENSALSAGSTTSDYVPAMYIGSDGKLNAEIWTGSTAPITTSSSVADGKWHLATLSVSGNTQTLYLDGAKVGSLSGNIDVLNLSNHYIGAGFAGAGWPDEPNSGGTAYPMYFTGDISDVAFWTRPVTAAEVAAMYSAGTHAAALATTVTRPSGKVYAQVAYNPLTAAVTSVTDSNGGTWTVAAPTVTGSSQVYASSVLGDQPAGYWRLGDTNTTDAVNQVNGGTAVYSSVTQGVTGGPFSDTTVDSFNGTSSYIQLPEAPMTASGDQSVSLWFKTSTANEVLYSYQNAALSAGSTSGDYVPALYIGSDGKLKGEFWTGTAAPISTSSAVDDGKWHEVVLSAAGTTQSMYLDGALVGTLSGNVDVLNLPNDYAGAGYISGLWPDNSHSGDTATPLYFKGDLAEVAVYPAALTAAEVTDQWQSSKYSSGLTPVENVTVTDPGGKTLSYRYDPLNGDRILAQTDALGNTTKYGYDVNGFLNTVTDPDGNVTVTGHDIRGNLVSQTTCQNQPARKCSTAYYSYYPDDTSQSPAADPRNDMLLTARDGRSSSASDNRYLTVYTYDTSGDLTAETTPPVPGFTSGRTTSYAYTTGTSATGGYQGAIPPAGLPYQEISPGGEITDTLYYADGDVAQVTDPDGQVTQYTYDGIGRVLSKTVISNSYPNGLVTSYAYNEMGQVVTETDPPVTDRVTGAVHTAQITTAYDADGNVLSQTVADTTGGDASRTVSYTYDSHDLLASSTDATGAVTKYTYDAYGDLATQTDPAGNVTSYVYDADGRLDTVTLDNYTGDPANPSAPVNLVESSRAYDPAGRMVSITDSMGNVTSYGYTDNGLVATITRTSPGGASFTEQANTYDAAGNLITQVTNNGATTTDDTVDAADRVTSQTLDPSGLDRVTNLTYSPDDQVITQSLSGSAGTPARVTDYTYDGLGNMTSQSVHDDNAALAPSGWWPLTDGTGVPANDYPTIAADDSGNGNPATRSSGVTWSSGSATLNGTSGSFATASAVLSTTASYSVSAWVDLASTSGFQTVVGQDGTADSAFNLQFDPTTGDWNLAHNNSDATGTTTTRAMSSSAAVTGTWTHLVGTYNASTGAMDLYVNGTLSGTATDTTKWASSGPLTIGRGLWDGNPTDWVNGQIANAQVYPYVLSAAQVSALYGGGRAATPAGEDRLTTTWTLDERGLPTSMTDPDGNVTHYSYDEAGRLAVTTAPTVTTAVYGGSATATAPVTMTGYDTFGEPVESSDANGNVTVTAYDADGRAVSVTAPPYTPPGSSSPITAQSSTTYNPLGQVSAQTDPLGNQTAYTYDQLGDVATVTAPNGGVTHYTYDTNGDQLSVTGPTGAQTQATYDYMGRTITSTQLERYPSAATNTTDYAYGTGGWLSSSTSPDGVTTSYAYDAAGEPVSVTDGAGNKTSYGYDVAGDRTSVTYPDGTQTTGAFDEAGRQTGSTDLSASGAALRSDSAAYDSDGNLVASTDYRGNTTSYTYDAAGDLTQEAQPVTPTSAITTSFGYDAAGNQTLYTDGNGNQWWTTYNSWNLPESRIEPTTSAYPTAAQSTFTTSYDADGRPVTLTEPGGVSVSDSYDSVGDLTGQSGSGASAVTATRSFGYDLAGNMTSASTSNTAPQSQPSNATSESFTYDDEGLLLTASGSAGSSSFTYDGDGQLASATTPAGTATYGYDDDGRLASMSDPATGSTLTYSYNSLSQLSQISYGAGADVRAFGYNSLHELTSDTLATSSGQTVASIGYGYDPNGNLTSKTTSSAFAGSATNTYAYDEANRLTSWNNGATTTSYAYDGAGNLTQAGSKTYTYDARDELTNDGSNGYSYSANGALASEATSSGTASFTTDAYGQQVTEGTQSYLYDALGRDVRVTSGSGGVTPLSYQGDSDQLTSDGAATYTWDPDGTLTGTGVVGGSPSQGVLDYTDQHTDVVGQFKASGTSLSGSSGYDPWGNVLPGSSLAGSLGYQSQFTDPATGKVQMGARWYSPGTGGFQDKDTVTVNPVPDPAAGNPFAYAADNPLTGTDPSGHMLCDGYGCGSAQSLIRQWDAIQAAQNACNAACQAAQQQASYWASQEQRAQQQAQQAQAQESSCSGWTSWFSPSCDLHRVESYVHAAVHYAMQAGDMVAKYTAEAARLAVRDTSRAVEDAANWGAHGARAAWHTVAQAGSRAYHDAAKWAAAGYQTVTHAVTTAYHYVARAATATVHYVEHHAATIAAVAVSVAAFAGCEAVTAGAGTIGCAAIAGAAGNAVSYAITAAQTGKFSWSGLGESVLTGAAVGALSGGLAEGATSLLSGLAGTVLGSGAAEAGDALATSATQEAVSTTTESAATTADATASTAADDAVARGGATVDEGGQGAQDSASSVSCGGESFAGSTRVLAASGALVPISELVKGEKVLATSTKTGNNQTERVAAVLVRHDTDLYDLKVRSDGRTAVIDTTSNHLFWVPGTHRWVKAGALRHGAHLRTPAGTDAVVTGGYVPRQHDGWMWDLTITPDHDFYIEAAGAGILVHNDSCPNVLSVGGPRVRPLITDETGVKGDIPVDELGNVHPPTPEELAAKDVHGMSTFDTPEHAAAQGLGGQLRSPTLPLPEGLGIISDGAEVGGPAPEGHYTIYPTFSMPFDDYVGLIKSMNWTNIGIKL